jgi:RNA polymerase sigma factor (sigma-70 family)
MPAPDLWRRSVQCLLADPAGVSDAELLSRFRTARDEAAFELLVYRHGPLVWSACRRLLTSHHDAEDAFQATFLALARQAGSIRRTDSVAAWLHRVAVRAVVHLARTRRSTAPPDRDPIDQSAGPAARAVAADLAGHLDRAVNRLPDRLRRVFVACELQGDPLADVAARLRCPIGTVASRLARARERVRALLSARGLAVGSLTGLAVAEIVPPAVRAAVLRGAAGDSGVPPAVAALAARASRPAVAGMTFGLATSLAAGLMGVAIALGRPDEPRSAPKPPPKDPPPAVAARTDTEGLPLPDGAIARLGSARFRHGGTYLAPVAFSSDGRRFAGGDSRGVHVWDVGTGRRVQHFPLPERGSPQLVRFLADDKWLAVGSGDWQKSAEVAVYELATGKVVDRTPFRGTGQIFVRDVTPDGAHVLVDDRGARVYLWDRKGGREEWAVDAAGRALQFTPDGKRFGVVHTRGAELRDAATGRVLERFPDPTRPFWNAHSATLASDGRLAVCAFDDSVVGVYEAGRAEAVHQFPAERNLVHLSFSPNGRYLVGSTLDGMSRVWDLKAPAGKELVARLPGNGGAFAPDGKTLALDALGGVNLWRVGDWRRLLQSPAPASGVGSVRFGPDGKRVYGHTAAGWLAWPAAGAGGDRLSDDSPTDPRGISDVSADGRIAADVLLRPAADGKPEEYTLRVTNLQTGKARRIPLDPASWWPVFVSDDGRFVWRSGSREFVAWDTATGEVVLRIKRAVADRLLQAVQFAPDGRQLRRSLAIAPPMAKGGPGEQSETAVFVTDHQSGREWQMDPAPFDGSQGRFSPDGTRLTLRGSFPGPLAHGAVSVWDTRSGRRLCAVPAASGYLHTFALSPDGRALLVGDNDGTMRYVEVATGGERGLFRHDGVVLSVAFDPSGLRAVSSSCEAPIYVWDLSGGDPGKWNPTTTDAVWTDLASPDAKVAFAAVRMLRANPADAIALLGERVKPPTVPPDDALAAGIKALDAPAFADRERAQKELTAVAELIRPKLEAARKVASEEAGRRLDQILKPAETPTPDQLRQVRACEVLEGLGTTEAVRLLRTWSAGPAGARLTAEAKESCDRIQR